DAIFAVVLLAFGEVVGERLQARRHILGIDAVDQTLAGRDGGGVIGAEDLGGGPDPSDLVGRQVPVVEQVAGSFDGALQPVELTGIGGPFDNIPHNCKLPTALEPAAARMTGAATIGAGH